VKLMHGLARAQGEELRAYYTSDVAGEGA